MGSVDFGRRFAAVVIDAVLMIVGGSCLGSVLGRMLGSVGGAAVGSVIEGSNVEAAVGGRWRFGSTGWSGSGDLCSSGCLYYLGRTDWSRSWKTDIGHAGEIRGWCNSVDWPVTSPHNGKECLCLGWTDSGFYICCNRYGWD